MGDHRTILAAVREGDIRHDPWGTALAWHLSICDLLTEWAPPYPDARWGYKQAMGGPDRDAYEYRELSDMIDAGEINADDLYRAGQILHRYEGVLERAGRSY